MASKYRVYWAPDGSGTAFCGEYDTLVEAQAVAETEPDGLPEAPDASGVEDEEPYSWHGEAHCVVRVRY